MEEISNIKELLNYSTNLYNENTLYKQKKIKYNEFGSLVNKLGTALIKNGLKNKKIGILSENRFEWEISFFAVTSGVGVVVPIDKSLTEIEIENIINRAEIAAIFCSNEYEKIVKKIIKNNKYLKLIISFDSTGETSFKELIKQGEDLIIADKSFLKAEIKENDVCVIIFTSGTTSTSKAAKLTHKNICSNLINVAKVFDITQKEVCLSVLPLNHVLEGLFCFLLSIYKGAERVFCNEIDEIIEYIKKYHITFMGGVPAIYSYLYEKKEELAKEAEHINMFMSGGARLDPKIVRKYNKIGITLVQGYGLTECSPVVSLENKNDHKLGSVGKVIPNIRIKLKDKDKDGIGEILIKGDNVISGYFKDQKNTSEIIKNGWFKTGDLAKIDEEGFINICGRKKEMIVLQNGKKIFPEEIETLLNKVNIIKESFVFENDDNKISAKIVCDNLELEKEIKKEIKKVNDILPQYKRISKPIFTTESLERTAIGKIKRFEEKEKILRNGKKIKKKQNKTTIDSSEKIKKIISNKLGIKDIKNEMSFVKDLGADSLDMVEIFLDVQKEFKIELTRDQKRSIGKVNDLIKIVNQEEK